MISAAVYSEIKHGGLKLYLHGWNKLISFEIVELKVKIAYIKTSLGDRFSRIYKSWPNPRKYNSAKYFKKVQIVKLHPFHEIFIVKVVYSADSIMDNGGLGNIIRRALDFPNGNGTLC